MAAGRHPLDINLRRESMPEHEVHRAIYDEDGVLIQSNPSLEIAACSTWLSEHGFPPAMVDHRMLSQDLIRNATHLAVDFIGIWQQAMDAGFPMVAPVALALGHVGGNPANCSRVEHRARARLNKDEMEAAAKNRDLAATNPLQAMSGHPSSFVRRLGQLVRLRQGFVIPQEDLTRLTIGYPGPVASPGHLEAIDGYLASVRDSLGGVVPA